MEPVVDCLILTGPGELDLIFAFARGLHVEFKISLIDSETKEPVHIAVSVIGMRVESTANRSDWTIRGVAYYQGIYPAFEAKYNLSSLTGKMTIGK